MDSLLKRCLGILLVPQIIFAQPRFTDVTNQAGIDHYFRVFGGIFGGGAAVLDYDLDGLEDVFITGGNGNNHLYKNNGDGTFKNVSGTAGMEVLDGVITQGAVSADVNKDGYPDLFVTTIALANPEKFTTTTDRLLINNQDGSFSDRSEEYGISWKTFSTGAAFGDLNKDGYPDLYVSTYFKDYHGKLDQYGGSMLSDTKGPARDLLYVNEGGARFVESSERYGMNHIGLAFQGVWSDFDNDNDLDLLIANDFGNRGHPDYLYKNEFPKEALTEIGKEKNFAYGINGMGIGVGDYNLDGWMDYLVTNIQISPFFVSQGKDRPFLERTKDLGTAFPTVHTNSGSGAAPVSWGVNFFDADNDMDLDLYITNGCLNPPLVPNPNLFLENVDGTFVERSKTSSTNDHSIGRGSVVFDYDNDGDLDLLVVNQMPFRDEDIGITFLGTRLYRNENTKNNWLKVKLAGKLSDTNGIGSRIELYVDSTLMIREVDGGSSNESQNSTISHFGLESFVKADSMIVRWSRSGIQKFYDVKANQTFLVVEEAKLKDILFQKVLASMRMNSWIMWLLIVAGSCISIYAMFVRRRLQRYVYTNPGRYKRNKKQN